MRPSSSLVCLLSLLFACSSSSSSVRPVSAGANFVQDEHGNLINLTHRTKDQREALAKTLLTAATYDAESARAKSQLGNFSANSRTGQPPSFSFFRLRSFPVVFSCFCLAVVRACVRMYVCVTRFGEMRDVVAELHRIHCAYSHHSSSFLPARIVLSPLTFPSHLNCFFLYFSPTNHRRCQDRVASLAFRRCPIG